MLKSVPSLLALAALCAATSLFAAPPAQSVKPAAAPAAPAPPAPLVPGGSYTPKVGDSVETWVMNVRSGKAPEVQAILRENLIPKMMVDDVISDTYFLAEDGEGNGVLALHFTSTKFAGRAPYQALLEEKLLQLLREPTKRHGYRLVLDLDEGFVPKAGDKAILFWWQVKKGSLAEAEALVRDQVFAALKGDPFQRRSYLLEDAAGSALVGVAFLRGEVIMDPKVVEKRKLLGPMLEKPERVATYTLFHFLDE